MKYAHLPPNKKVGEYAYNHQALLGTGAFGKVYLGRDQRSKKLVAIKILENDQISDPYLKEALIKEITLMKKLNGPNIVRFLDTLKSVNHTYIIQEFCSGGDFRNYLTKKGKIAENEARKILQDFLNGFAELVKLGYLHRDLKPENILIDNDVFKLADFGFATQVQNFQSLLKTVVGTPLYMSPQILMHENYTSKSDVWSTGLIYYEMLCGKTPWPARDQIELIENIKKMPIRFPFDVKISDVSKDFIKGCLQNSEKNRLNWEEIFNHPIYTELAGCISPTNKIGKKPTNTITEKALLVLNELQEIFVKRGVDLKKVFKNFDKHADGSLDIKEFTNLIKCINENLGIKEIEEIFNRFDQDGSGTIDFEEFQRLIMETDYKTKSEDNQMLVNYRGDKMFKNLINVIYNNRIDVAEIFTDHKMHSLKSLDFEEFRNKILKIDDSMENNDIKYIFWKFDSNRDQKISSDEFQKTIDSELAKMPGYNENRPISYAIMSNASVSSKKQIENLRNIIIKNGLNVLWVFEHFDTSGDKSLDFKEFKTLLEVFNARFAESEVREMFKAFDVNGDGDISLKEFEFFLK